MSGDFQESVIETPITDLNIFGIFTDSDFETYRKMSLDMSTSCFFVRNSGHENIFA